jgi:glycosyltransferase involved in cell wall biosynthesis
VLCVSDDDAAHFERVGGQPIVVPNGVDDDLFDIPAEPPLAERVLFFGRLDYEPNALGLERFVREGWPRLVSRRPDARLVIVGPGLLERTARLLSAAPRCETLGLVTDLPAELATARLVIVPIWQGGGTRLKVLESLAAARPLVGTPLGVAGIGFRDGVHGVLADDPTGLADAAAALLADPARSTELAVAGRGLATRFRWSTATAPAAALYERWIG